MIEHHPDDDLIVAFAAGRLSNGLGLAIACHLEFCDRCRRLAHSCEMLGGSMLNTLEDAELDLGGMEAVLAKLDDVVMAPSGDLISKIDDNNVPKPLRRFIPEGYAELPWSGFGLPVESCELTASDSDLKVNLHRIKAGKLLPRHTHKGNEYTLVLDGAFSDRLGHYCKGDFVVTDPQVNHQPKADDDSDCLCLAVLDAPLKFTGPLGRMLNPFARW